MTDLKPAPVPELSEEWIASHRAALVEALSQRRRRPSRWVALGGAAAVAATVSTLVLVGGSPQAAFAGWTAAPTAPATGQVTSAEAVCQARLGQAAQLRPSNKSAADATSLVPELSDVRGPYTVTVFGNSSQVGALCISTPSAVSLRWVTGSGTPGDASSITVDQMSLLARDGQPYTLVEGRTGVGVTGVTLTLGTGTNVTATSGDGLFVAWWPGREVITSAAVSTASGVSIQPLNLPGPSLPPSGAKPSPLAPARPSTSADSQNGATVCLIHSCD